MGYGEHLEWLSSSGFDTSFAGNGINPLKDHYGEEEDYANEEAEEGTDGE